MPLSDYLEIVHLARYEQSYQYCTCEYLVSTRIVNVRDMSYPTLHNTEELRSGTTYNNSALLIIPPTPPDHLFKRLRMRSLAPHPP